MSQPYRPPRPVTGIDLLYSIAEILGRTWNRWNALNLQCDASQGGIVSALKHTVTVVGCVSQVQHIHQETRRRRPFTESVAAATVHESVAGHYRHHGPDNPNSNCSVACPEKTGGVCLQPAHLRLLRVCRFLSDRSENILGIYFTFCSRSWHTLVTRRVGVTQELSLM
jgi:hypothetical protein